MARFPTPHRAALREYVEDVDEEWIEGEPGEGPEPAVGEEFPCYLFLPLGSEEAGARAKKVSRPTVMWLPAEVSGDAPTADDELMITAGDYVPVLGVETVRWQIEGEPQPFGPPGGPLIGVQAILKRVTS